MCSLLLVFFFCVVVCPPIYFTLHMRSSFIYCAKYLLKIDSFSAGQEIPRLYLIQRFVTVFTVIYNWVLFSPSEPSHYLSKINFNFFYAYVFPKRSLPLRLSDQNFLSFIISMSLVNRSSDTPCFITLAL
jgi:hypothetical protein